MGTRAQAQNINLNRDFMKLDTPEGKASAKLWVDYDPHVGYDLHTSNGSCHAYYLTYSPPLNPDTSDPIMSIMKNEWFPFVTKQIKAKHGWDTFYYGNTQSREGECPGGGRGRGRGDAAAGPRVRPAPARRRRLPHRSRRPRRRRRRPAVVGHVRARAALPQQLRRPAQPLRAAERGLLVRDVRGPHQGHELLHGRERSTSRSRTSTRSEKATADADREAIIGKPLAHARRDQVAAA